MKRIFYILLIIVSGLGWGLISCTQDFEKTNTDPNVISNPDLRHLFTHSLYQMGDYQYTEWFYDNYQYIYTYTQLCVSGNGNSSDFNRPGAIGGRYGAWFTDIMPNLFEIRRQIDNMSEEEKAKHQKMYQATYILQIMQGLKVTDFFGALPYREALRGRYESFFTPVYDPQESLFEQWSLELTTAVNILASNPAVAQVEFQKQDFVYEGDWDKWAKLGNSLKLRLAVRLEKANSTKAQSLIQDATTHSAGLVTTMEDQFWWEPTKTYRGRAHDFWNNPMAAKYFMEFLKKNKDPRTRIIFERNEFTQAAIDTFRKHDLPLPKFVDELDNPIDEVWDRYWGGPVSPDSTQSEGEERNPYFYDFRDHNNNSYRQLSRLNWKFYDPRYNNNDGRYVAVMLSAAEVCLYMAEFIEKGFTSGSAQEWLQKGVEFSVLTYNEMAKKAEIDDLELLGLQDGELDILLGLPDYNLNGEDNMEKIYIQEHINFMRTPTEAFTLSRRTGFPFRNGNILMWEPVMDAGQEMALPRRWPVNEPSLETNLENFFQAMEDQGFSVSTNDPDVLNQQRVWWDKTSPNYGDGK